MKNRLLFFATFFTSIICFGQRGVMSGTITDDTGPLPGVTILVKGTTNGTETDFDGNYSIKCSVGDVLLYSFVGMKTKEVVVTSEMLGQTKESRVLYMPVKKITNTAYDEAIKNLKKKDSTNSIRKYANIDYNSGSFYFNFDRIKEIICL